MKHLLILAALLIGCMYSRAQSTLAANTLPLAAKLNASKTVYKDFTLYRYSADNIDHKVYYNLRGAWLYTILSYDERGLPSPIKSRIKSDYDDYRISWVDEIRSPGHQPVYRVQLNSCTRLVIVQVDEEEMVQEAEYDQ